jgi:hypothetical protein
MSTVSKIPARGQCPLPLASDPWYYGYRYAQIVAADGTATLEQVPLTLDDVLFPQEGDFIVHTEGHLVDIIADVSEPGKKRHLQLLGYKLTRTRYKPLPPDAQGRIYLEAVRLWAGVTRDPRGGYDRLACYDPETGHEFGDYTAVLEACAKAREQATAAQRRARAAERKARTEAHARAQAEARAQVQAELRAGAEARIRELETELKQSRSRKP